MRLHAEIGRLSERFRAAVVLCYLEGRTNEEAARVLHCPVGTITSRLSTARLRQRRRLEPPNLAPSAGSVGLLLEENPPETTLTTPAPEPILQAVVRHATDGMVPTAISQLTRGWSKSGRLRPTAMAGTGSQVFVESREVSINTSRWTSMPPGSSNSSNSILRALVRLRSQGALFPTYDWRAATR
jgi:hypothetical protein